MKATKRQQESKVALPSQRADESDYRRGGEFAESPVGDGVCRAGESCAARSVGSAGRSLRSFLSWALVILMLSGCGAAEKPITCKEDRRCLHYAISADIPLLDPHFSSLPEAGMILRQIYDTLVFRDDASGVFRPGLATDWDISEDGLVYTFRLRRDLLFHDGSEFTAEAVATNLKRIFQAGSGQSRARDLLAPLRQFEVMDKHTIRLRLLKPHAALLDSLAQPFLGIASPAALEASDGLRYQYHQAGTGRFMLESYLPGERVVLRRFGGASASMTSNASRNGVAIERIEFAILRDLEGDLITLLGDTYDVIDNVSPAAAHNLAGNSSVILLPIRIPGLTIQFLFNTNRSHLKDRNVRLALQLATNRIGIGDQVFLNASPVAWAPLSESTGYAHTGFVNTLHFDLDQAQDLLEAAGYADSDGDGILDKSGDPLELKVLTPPWGQLPEVAAFLKEQWRQIGIDLVAEPAPGMSLLNSLIQSNEYDLLPIGKFGLDPAVLGEVFLQGSPYARSSAPHPQLSDLLNRAAQENDPVARRNMYYEAQSILMNEALVLPLRENVRIRAISASVGGLYFDAYGFYPLPSDVIITEP
jgi:peptide/nickel transport system substrate-binding protein